MAFKVVLNLVALSYALAIASFACWSLRSISSSSLEALNLFLVGAHTASKGAAFPP